MPAANPIVEGIPGRGPVAAAPPVGGGTDAPASPAPAMSLGGLGTFTSPDNTSVHVGVLVAGAFAVVLLLYFGGFTFAADVGVTRP